MNPRQRNHNRRVKTTTAIALMVALMSIMCLDSDSWVPCIALGLSLAYIFLFYMANK